MDWTKEGNGCQTGTAGLNKRIASQTEMCQSIEEMVLVLWDLPFSFSSMHERDGRPDASNAVEMRVRHGRNLVVVDGGFVMMAPRRGSTGAARQAGPGVYVKKVHCDRKTLEIFYHLVASYAIQAQ